MKEKAGEVFGPAPRRCWLQPRSRCLLTRRSLSLSHPLRVTPPCRPAKRPALARRRAHLCAGARADVLVSRKLQGKVLPGLPVCAMRRNLPWGLVALSTGSAGPDGPMSHFPGVSQNYGTTRVPLALVMINGGSRTSAADGPRSGAARQTTRASKSTPRLRRPMRVSVAVASTMSPA